VNRRKVNVCSFTGGLLQICRLSGVEVSGLENFGVHPDCRHHNHLRRMDAEHLVQSGQGRWVGLKQRAVTATRGATDRGYDNSFGPQDDRILAIATSGAFLTRQLLHGGDKRGL
jgi:hypothetical protein